MTDDADIRPWAMQLVTRVEKSAPPEVLDVARGAVLATIAVLTNDEAAVGGLWHYDIDAWCGKGRIRKIMRRARGADWERAQEPAGVTVTASSATVRAFVPSPLDAVPRAIGRLQIRSDALAMPEPVDELPALAPDSMVIALTPKVTMSWGKAAAQAAHAGQRLWETASAEQRARWFATDQPVEVVFASPGLWNDLVANAEVSILDAGFTEVPPNTQTAVGRWSTTER